MTVCGDGVVEGAEECDDFNDFGGDGCSAVCLREIKAHGRKAEGDIYSTYLHEQKGCNYSLYCNNNCKKCCAALHLL